MTIKLRINTRPSIVARVTPRLSGVTVEAGSGIDVSLVGSTYTIAADDPADHITIEPTANTLNRALEITQTSPTTGTTVGPLSYNLIDVTHQVGVTGSEQQASGLRLDMHLGGSSLAGHPVIGIYSNVLKTIANVGGAADKIGVVGSVYCDQADGNAGIYGENPVATVGSGGTVQRCVGLEAARDIRSGGAAAYSYCVMAANYGVSQGSTLDTAFIVGNIGTSGGAFANMLTLSNSLGQAPMSTTGSLFISDTAATIANVFNMSNVTVTGNILNFPNVTLTGNGLLTLPDVMVTGGPATLSASGQGSIGASANGGLIVTGRGNNFDLLVNNKDGTNVCAIATGTTTLSVNTLSITNALGVASGGTGDTGTAWTTYSPTITAAGGTFTSVSAAGRYKDLGKTRHISVRVTITTAGTATGAVIIPLPNGTAAATQVVNGQLETTGVAATALILSGTGSLNATKYDANTLIGSGNVFTVQGTIELT